MTRILLLSMLLTLVYSWDELKRAVRVLFYRVIFQKRPLLGPDGAIRTDELVSTAVVFATVPVSLTLLLESADPFRTLTMLALTLAGVSAVAYASSLLARRINVMNYLPAGLTLVGFVSPVFSVVSRASFLPRKLLSKFSLYMAAPPAVGLLVRFGARSSAPAEILPNLDVLILVLVGALFLQLAAEFLGRFLRRLRFFRLFFYYRIALGVVIVAVLLH